MTILSNLSVYLKPSTKIKDVNTQYITTYRSEYSVLWIKYTDAYGYALTRLKDITLHYPATKFKITRCLKSTCLKLCFF